MEAISDNEVHDEIESGEFNIDPDCFKEMFGEIAKGDSSTVSLKGAEYLFKQIGYEVPEVVKAIIKDLDDMQALNPGSAEDKARRIISHMHSIQTLYVMFSGEFSKHQYQMWPNTQAARGSAEKAKDKMEADTADMKAVKNFLRNLFYITSKAASIAQSLMKTERLEHDFS
jgi:hypothetical protein